MDVGYNEALKFFIGLLAIINPFGVLPIFISLTKDMTPEERRHINVVTHIAVTIILVVSMFLGEEILEWFGISLNAFRIAGGMLICIIAYNMMQGSLRIKGSRDSQDKGLLLLSCLWLYL